MKSIKNKFNIFIFILVGILINNNLIAQCNGSVEVIIPNLNSNSGTIFIALYESTDSRFNDKDLAYKSGIVEIKNAKNFRYVFNDVAQGKYAIAVLHDANNDKKLNTNILGIPKEGFGFSLNPKVHTRSPRICDCSFVVNPNKTTDVNIKLNYF